MVDRIDLLCGGLIAVTAFSLYTAFDARREARNNALVTSESVVNYEFHPFLNSSAPLLPDYSQESPTLSKISFDSKQPGSLETVLRNIVYVGEFNSVEPINPRHLLRCEKKPRIYLFDLGQGLMVSDQGHMLTAAHIIIDHNDRFQDWNPFGVVAQDKKVYEVERILAISEKYDLALVKTSYRPENFTPPNFSTSPKPGETYTLVGVKMTGDLHIKLNDSGSIALRKPQKINFVDYYSQGVFESADASLQRYDGTTQFVTDMLLLDQHSEPGFSGSVAADSQGKIIGFVSGYRSIPGYSSDNRVIVSKSARVKELLNQYLTKIKPKL